MCLCLGKIILLMVAELQITKIKRPSQYNFFIKRKNDDQLKADYPSNPVS